MTGLKLSKNKKTDPFQDPIEEIIKKRFGRLGREAETRGLLVGIGLLAIAAGLAYLGTRVGDPLDKVADSVRKTEKRLDELAKEIKGLICNVNEILQLLKELPDIIRGIVDDNSFRDAMSLASSVSGDIQSYFISEAVADGAYKDKIFQMQLISLQNSISSMLMFGGLSAIIHVAPYYATWAQTFSYVERRKDKEARRLLWEHSTHLNVMQAFKNVFAITKSEIAKYQPLIDILPWPDNVYGLDRFVEGVNFKLKRLPMRSHYSPKPPNRGSSGLFTVHKINGVPRLLSTAKWKSHPFDPRPSLPSTGPGGRNDWYWFDTSLAMRPWPFPQFNPFASNLREVQRAHTRFNTVLEDYIKIDRFLYVFGQADEWDSLLKKYVEEPPLEWQRDDVGIPRKPKPPTDGRRKKKAK